jgi:hypothetical protein
MTLYKNIVAHVRTHKCIHTHTHIHTNKYIYNLFFENYLAGFIKLSLNKFTYQRTS